jgi:geranylgeranyl diphosphate synthase type I
MQGGKVPRDAAAAGAAMELFQSAFLVHDDIMDRDMVRRGMPAVHAQYAAVCADVNLRDASHIGEALGICAGDIAIFLAFEILARLESGGDVKNRLIGRFCRELQYVGLAQMADVYNGAARRPLSREEILSLYRYKTGRYTFSLPFAAGLVLAGADEAVVEDFVLLGEKLGILFQIKDDELGIWADEGELGKPVGSDICENKKTLYREILFRRAEEPARSRLAGIFGGCEPSAENLAFVRTLLEDLGVRGEVEVLVDELSAEAGNLISTLTMEEPWRRMLRDLLDYNLTRKK